MGLAKYFEDNVEVMCERQASMQLFTKKVENPAAHYNILSALNVVSKVGNTAVKTEFTDKYIFCKDCGEKFLFSANAQRYFEKKGWCIPKRCKYCRSIRKLRYSMR